MHASSQSTKPLIAIVDDDESTCRALARLLRCAGMDTKVFVSAVEFIVDVESNLPLGPGCIVLDYQMPARNGLEVQAQLNAMGCLSPVVFITSADDSQIREHALAAGAAAFLVKPLDGETFIGALVKALELQNTGKPIL